jgi:acylphosphatase
MAENEKIRLHAVIEGYVQGVGFRAFVQDQAIRLGVSGWVRNRWDGSVEVLAEGERLTLEKLLTALYRGPRASQVTGVNPEWLPASGEFSGFRVQMTSG